MPHVMDVDISTAALALLRKIAKYEPHRGSQKAYDELVRLRAVDYRSPLDGGEGWEATRAGKMLAEAKPTKRPKRMPLVGRVARTRWPIPAHPVGIPRDTMVDVVDHRNGRYLAVYRGTEYWIDVDALEGLG